MNCIFVHDCDRFRDLIAPQLAKSWRLRSLAPIVQLAAELGPTIRQISEQHCLTADEQPLLFSLTRHQPFDRHLWRHLAGEFLLYAAVDSPVIQDAEEALRTFVGNSAELIRQAYHGSRELDFGGIPYRSGNAAWNDPNDVTRLANFLEHCDSSQWLAGDLILGANAESEDADEELAFARHCLELLRNLYVDATRHNRVIILETL